MRNGRIEVGIVDQKGEEREWIALKHLKEDSGEFDNYRLYKYCCALIDLASEMCLERNHRALNYFVDIYPIDIVIKSIMHNELDYNVKSKFTKMVETMYVNKEPFDHLQVPHFSRIWNEISLIGNRIQFYKEEIPKYLLELKAFTIKYLKETKGEQSIFDGERNQMTLQVIKLVKLMVSYGFYRTKDELRELSITLISLLNGSCDIYDLQEEDSFSDDYLNLNHFRKMKSNDLESKIIPRHQKTQDNVVIMYCKEEICDILLRILEIEDDLKISLFLGFFKDGIESNLVMEMDDEFDSQLGAREHTSKVFHRELSRRHFADDMNENRQLSQATKVQKESINNSETIKWLEKVLMGEQLFDAFPQGTYVCILMDLLAYDYTNLNNKAFELLLKFFNQRYCLIELLKQIQLLEKADSIEVLKKVTKIGLELKSFVEVINQWMDEEKQSQENIFDVSTKLISTKESVDYLVSILVEKHHRSRRGILEEIPNTGRSHEDSLVIAVNGRIMKRSEISDKDLTTNVENQRLVKNLGIPKILIQILKISLSEAQKSNEDYQDLIRSIYLFLIRFCSDQQEYQNMIGEHLDFLLKDLESCPLVVFLIKEIFKNNKSFIASKRTYVVQYIAQKEAKLSIDSDQKQHYLMILKALSKNHNKTSTKTANEILNIITPIDDSTIQCFFETKEEMEKAKNITNGFKKDIAQHSMNVKEKEESPEEQPIPKSQVLFGNFKIVLDYLEKADFFLPFKKSVVEYLYHLVKANQRDIYSSESCEELLWKILTNLVQDCEQKAEADDLYDEVKSYGYPLNETHKSISDKYIFKNIYIVISTVMKMNLEFDERAELVKRIAVVTSK